MKKILLSVIFALFFLILSSGFPTSVYAFLGFGEGGSSNELDCQKLWEDLSRETETRLSIVPEDIQGGERKISSNKQIAKKDDADYCDLKGEQYDADVEHELLSSFEYKIVYYADKNVAKDKVGLFKSTEVVEIKPEDVSEDMYSMRTLNFGSYGGDNKYLQDGNHARTVGRVGNCLVSLTQTWWAAAHQWNLSIAGSTPDSTGQNLMDGLLNNSKNGWKTLRDAKAIKQFCGDNAKLDQSSVQETGQKTQEKQASQSNQSSGQNTVDSKGILDIINPYQLWLNFQAYLHAPYLFNNLINTGEVLFGNIENLPESLELINGEYYDFLPGYIPGESIYQYPEKIIKSTEPVRFSNETGQTQIEARRGENNQTTIRIPEKNGSGLLFLEEGEVEVVKKPSTNESEYEGIRTPNGTIISIQTHYLVKYDKKRNQTTVVVYEGKVEVKTNEGKTTTVAPEDSKPGVVIIAQKLSPMKLTLAGLVLAAAIGGFIFFLKRKFTLKATSKKKK